MTKTVPTTVTLPNLANFRPGEEVTASEWRNLQQTLQYVYARQGAVVNGLTFDPYWESLDFGSGGSSYHSTNSSAYAPGSVISNIHAHPEDWTGVFRFQRLLYDTVGGAQAYQVQFNAYAKNLDLRCTLTRLNTSEGNTSATTAFTTLTTSHAAADSEWQLATLTFTKAQASRGGSTSNGLAFFLAHVEAKVPASGAGNLWCFGLRETVITAGTALPRGA